MAPSQIVGGRRSREPRRHHRRGFWLAQPRDHPRSEEHTSELQSQSNLVCRLLLEKKKMNARVEPPPSGPPSPLGNSVTDLFSDGMYVWLGTPHRVLVSGRLMVPPSAWPSSGSDR